MNLKITHTVFKNEDVEKYLSEEEKQQLQEIKDKLACHRIADGMKINNYIICNTDEPYAEKVLDIIQNNDIQLPWKPSFKISDNANEMGMYDLAHNQFFIKDGEAWHRDFEREISCRNLIREIAVKQGIWKSCEEHGLDADNEMIDDDIFDDTMLDELQYGTDEPIGVLAMYYSAMWAFAEIRAELIDRVNKPAH